MVCESSFKVGIIDFDRTLVNTDVAQVNAMVSALDSKGLSLPPYTNPNAYAATHPDEFYRCYAPGIGLKEMRRAQDNAFLQNIHQTKLVSGVHLALEQMKHGGLNLVLWTRRTVGLEELMEEHRLRRYFVEVVDGWFDPQKPKPDAIYYVAKKSGRPTSELVVVGDSVAEAAPARLAGAHSVTIYGIYGDSPSDHPEICMAKGFTKTVMKRNLGEAADYIMRYPNSH